MEIISRKNATELGLKVYFTGQPCKHGHIAERRVSNRECCECRSIYEKKWRESNIERKKEYRKQYYRENKETELLSNKKWREKNPGYHSQWHKEWAKNNPEKAKKLITKWHEENKHKPEYKIPRAIRSILKRCINALKDKKTGKAFDVIGYGPEELRQRMEVQFKQGMSWDNYGEWHIDHKKPVSVFIRQGETRPHVINALSNLQPLWAEENIRKSAKFSL